MLLEPDGTIKIIHMRMKNNLDYKRYAIRIKNAEWICELFLNQNIYNFVTKCEWQRLEKYDY